MSWSRLLAATVLGGIIAAFLVSLLAVVVRGPVAQPPSDLKLELRISPARLRADVERLCGEFSPRDYRQPQNLARAADWIAEQFRAAGLSVELQEYELPQGRFRNVIAFQGGSEPLLGAVVVGAHYDAYGGFPGADDNASGVAALLELVRTLPPGTPRSDRYFVAFSTEEPPLFGTPGMGSAMFAESLVDRGIQVNLMLALDSVGYFSPAPGSQRFPLFPLRWIYPDRGDFIAVVGDLRAGRWIQRARQGIRVTGAIDVQSFRGPGWVTGVRDSDHLSFRARNLPGVLITDTAFLRYEHYHEPGDTPERLDYERLARLVHGLHGVLWDGRRD